MMAIAFASHAACADVTGIEIASRTDVLAGKPFGDVGAYADCRGAIVARTWARWDAATQGTPLAGR